MKLLDPCGLLVACLHTEPHHWLKSDNEAVRGPAIPLSKALSAEQHGEYSSQFPWRRNGLRAGWTGAPWCGEWGRGTGLIRGPSGTPHCSLQMNGAGTAHSLLLALYVWHATFERMLLFYIGLTSFNWRRTGENCIDSIATLCKRLPFKKKVVCIIYLKQSQRFCLVSVGIILRQSNPKPHSISLLMRHREVLRPFITKPMSQSFTKTCAESFFCNVCT